MKSEHKHKYHWYSSTGIITLRKCKCGGIKSMICASPEKIASAVRKLRG